MTRLPYELRARNGFRDHRLSLPRPTESGYVSSLKAGSNASSQMSEAFGLHGVAPVSSGAGCCCAFKLGIWVSIPQPRGPSAMCPVASCPSRLGPSRDVAASRFYTEAEAWAGGLSLGPVVAAVEPAHHLVFWFGRSGSDAAGRRQAADAELGVRACEVQEVFEQRWVVPVEELGEEHVPWAAQLPRQREHPVAAPPQLPGHRDSSADSPWQG